MTPYIKEFRQGAVADLAALHQIAVEYVEDAFARHGEVEATWMIYVPARLSTIVLCTPFENQIEKEAFTGAVIGLAAATGASMTTFVCEAWVSTYKKGEDTSVPPSDRPVRDDIVFLSSESQKGESLMTRYLVNIRNGRGLNFLGPRIDEPDFQMAGGLMGKVFDKIKQQREGGFTWEKLVGMVQEK